MRAVLDTNIVVSALLTPDGTCARVLDLAAQHAFQPCMDGRTLAEHEAVLHRLRLRIEPTAITAALDLFRVVGIRVAAPPLPVTLPHSKDLPFLEVAAAADAVLVTGNKRHFPPKACAGVQIVSPAEFLDLLSRPL